MQRVDKPWGHESLLGESTTEVTDVVRLEDRYGRQGANAP